MIYNFCSQKKSVLFGGLAGVALLAGCGSDVGSADDPVIDSTPIIYVERENLIESEDDDGPVFFERNNLEPAAFMPGARLMLRANASVGAVSEHLFATKLCDRALETSDLFVRFCNGDRSVRAYDVKDIAVSHDGDIIAFAVRAPEPEDDDAPEPTWDLWTYEFDSDELSPLMVSAAVSAIGDDMSPTFLPDGDIVFSSSLQQRTRALLLDEGKSQYQGLEEDLDVPALSLHRIDISGNTISQLTFNISHDLHPAILPDGRVIFSRWDNMGGVSRVNLYTIRPDGADLQIFYGAHSHERLDGNQQEFFRPKAADNGQLLIHWAVREPQLFATQFLYVNGENYIDNTTPVFANLGAVGPAQTTPFGFKGQFAFASPLNDSTGRILAVWSPCRLFNTLDATQVFACTEENEANTDLTQAPPLYGLWMFDTDSGAQTLIQAGTESSIATEAVVVAERQRAPILAPLSSGTAFNTDAAAENLAQLHIRSVYDIAGADSSSAGIGVLADPLQTSPDDRPIRFMRVIKGVRIPPDEVKRVENADFGVSRQQSMREMIGYVPVEPDGSVTVLVPAEVPLAISFLDMDGQRVSNRHQNWLHFKPGEVFECQGCHANGADESVHGRRDAQPPSVNIGALANTAFPNTQTSLAASVGESMAQVWARVNGPRRLSVDIIYEDEWTDTTSASAGTSISLLHEGLETESPLSPACVGIDGAALWTPLCRVQIHYPTHIEPLWSLAREGLAGDGVTVEDRTCNSCHTRRDLANEIIVPAGQLELSADPSPEQARHSISYRELLTNDSEVEVRDGALQDRLVQVLLNSEPIPVLDEEGEPVLDINDEPIFETTTVGVARSMNAAGARQSRRFFNTMTTEIVGATVDHRGYLSDSELLLIREWLDMGAQYYNDPFLAPR